MERQMIETCSLCRRANIVGVAPTGSSSIQICQQCACDMYMAIQQSANAAEHPETDRIHDLFDEWMLFVCPLAIVLISITIQPDSSNKPWAPLLQALGVVFLLGGLFYEMWGTIVRKQWTPSGVVPLLWVGCGAFMGYPVGPIATLIGGALGLTVWIGCRYLVKRLKIRRLLTGGGSSLTRH